MGQKQKVPPGTGLKKEEKMDAVIQKDEIGNGRANNREAIIERKLRLVENPSSIVIAPKTREGHTFVKILFAFDRAVSRIRLRAGTYIKVQDAVSCLKQAEGFIASLNELILSLGDGRAAFGSYFEDPETKKMLAGRLSTYIILPRTSEGKEVALMIKRLDPAILQFRSICTDFARSEEILKNLIETIMNFDMMVQGLSSLASIPYDPPRDLGTLLKLSSPVDQSLETHVEDSTLREEEAPPKKGRKSGGMV